MWYLDPLAYAQSMPDFLANLPESLEITCSGLQATEGLRFGAHTPAAVDC